MQDLPGQTFKNLIRIFLQDLERFLQGSYKICKKRSKFLQGSCQILDKILHDISSREVWTTRKLPATRGRVAKLLSVVCKFYKRRRDCGIVHEEQSIT